MVHGLVVEAVERQSAAEEGMAAFVAAALAADADVERTGAVHRADEVTKWIAFLAAGRTAPRPKPCRR